MESQGTLEDAIWAAFMYAEDLLSAAHEIQEAIDACLSGDSDPHGSEVARRARHAALLIESDASAVADLIEAARWAPPEPAPDDFVYHGDEYSDEAELDYKIDQLKRGLDLVDQWVKSVLRAGRIHRQRLPQWLATAQSLRDIVFHLEHGLELLAEVQSVRDRIEYEATTVEPAATPTGRSSASSKPDEAIDPQADGDDDATSADQDDARLKRGQFVYELRTGDKPKSWDEVLRAFENSEYELAPRSTLSDDMARYCKSTNMPVPKGRSGRPRKPDGGQEKTTGEIHGP